MKDGIGILICASLSGCLSNVAGLFQAQFKKNISVADATICLHCFDAVGWAAGRASSL